ncbi:hypothetical protein [Kangiella sp.]|uniref:hypothetical protein n=1 Tax=Kangiella sp. TaxID=1920245 RepID=UPI0025B8EDD1|nr:hypothetical protein [Kangiella sp.]
MMMKPTSKPFRVPVFRALLVAAMSSLALSSFAKSAEQGDSYMSDELFVMDGLPGTQFAGFKPFVIDDSSVRVTANDISVSLLANNKFNALGSKSLESDPLAFSIKDEEQGEWLVSLDLSRAAQTKEANSNFLAAYQAPNQTSQFFVNYGKQSLPVSVSIDDSVHSMLDQKALEQNSVGLGFNQEVGQGWDVTISYMKSDIEMVTTKSALSELEQQDTGYRFYYDFNQDGSPESINLKSNLAGIESFQQDLEGIEIKISRQVNDDFTLGASVESGKGRYQEHFLGLQEQDTPFEASALSLYGGMRFAEDWTLAANVNKQESKLSLNSGSSELLEFEDTTLDIGLQYQTRWNKTGLVIRIDLMNLLGAAHLEDSMSQSMDLDASGLVPYTFQSPKYIKLSGSINF